MNVSILKTSRQQARVTLLFFAALILAYYISANIGSFFETPSQHAQRRDFIVFYTASNFLKEGKAADIFQPEIFTKAIADFKHETESNPSRWLYPPSFLPFIRWLSHFNYFYAFALWGGVQLFLFWLAGRNYLFHTKAETFIFLCIPSALQIMSWGDSTLFFAALSIGAFRQMERRPALSGVLWGLAAIRPTLLLLMPFMLLANRNYKTIAYGTATFGLTVLLSLSLYGTQPWLNYFTANRASLTVYVSDANDLHLGMPTVFASLSLLRFSQPVSYAAQAAAFLATSWFMLRSWPRLHAVDATGSIAVFFLLSVLATPYACSYDFVTATSVTVCWLLKRREFSFPALLLLIAVYHLNILNDFLNWFTLPVTPLLLAGLTAYIVRSAHSEKPMQL